jgi:hypothetical protein
VYLLGSFYCRVGLPITGRTVNIGDVVGVMNMYTDRVIDRAEKPVTEN